jgi:hypothetical protein
MKNGIHKFLVVTAGLNMMFSACEQKLEQRARVSAETCSSYNDLDKQNWCLGKCDQVKNPEYQKICRKNSTNSKD